MCGDDDIENLDGASRRRRRYERVLHVIDSGTGTWSLLMSENCSALTNSHRSLSSRGVSTHKAVVSTAATQRHYIDRGDKT